MCFPISSLNLIPETRNQISFFHKFLRAILGNTCRSHIPKPVSYPCAKLPPLTRKFIQNDRFKLSNQVNCFINWYSFPCRQLWLWLLHSLFLSNRFHITLRLWFRSLNPLYSCLSCINSHYITN